MPKKTDKYFTNKQLKAIELMAHGVKALGEIAQEVGVNPSSISRWKKDPKFMHAIIMRSRELLKQDLPAVYSTLAQKSEEGSAQHIKIMLDHLENLESAHASQAVITFTWKKKEEEETETEEETNE